MTQLLIVPGSPALVRELAPADVASARVRAAARGLSPRGPVDLVSSRDERWYTAHAGSLGAWGAPSVTVGGGHHLPELVARYLFPETAICDARARIGQLDRDTILVLDGSAGLTPRAPLALLDHGSWAHTWCQELLGVSASGGGAPDRGAPAGDGDSAPDADRLREAGIVEPELWLELAALRKELDTAGRLLATELVDADATTGVGRYVARWEVA